MERKQLLTTKDRAVGKFAVMRQAVKTARFCALHDTLESAQEEARRLAGIYIAERGLELDTLFFVVELRSAHGWVDGKLVGH